MLKKLKGDIGIQRVSGQIIDLVNKFMFKRIIITLFLIFTIINLISQSLYFGKNRFGRLELINDSMGIICINSVGQGLNIYDTIYYRKKNDTMWISTILKERYSIVRSDSAIPVLDGPPVIIRRYKKVSNTKYKILQQFILPYDTINKQIIFNDLQPPLENGEILFIDLVYGGKFLIDEPYFSLTNSNHFAIRFNDALLSKHYFFHLNEFPLKIKKNKLIPISNEAQQWCWIYNNHYFPVMKKAKKEKHFYTFARHFSGDDMGLQRINCFRDKPLKIKIKK